MMQKVLCKELKYRWPAPGDKIVIKNYYENNNSGVFTVLKIEDEKALLIDIDWYNKYFSSDYSDLYTEVTNSTSVYSETYAQYSNGNYYQRFEMAYPNYLQYPFETYYNSLSSKTKNNLVSHNCVQTTYDYSTSSYIANSDYKIYNPDNSQTYYFKKAGDRTTTVAKNISLPSLKELCDIVPKDANNRVNVYELYKFVTIDKQRPEQWHNDLWTLDTPSTISNPSAEGDLGRYTFAVQFEARTTSGTLYYDKAFIRQNYNSIASKAYILPKIKIDLRKLDWDWYQA